MWGDLDNDGWLDVVIANGVLKDGSVPQIYRNNRDGTFTNMTKAAGIDEPAAFGAIGAALGDYDKDGRLDIFFNGLDPRAQSPVSQRRQLALHRGGEEGRRVRRAPHNGFVCFFVDYNNDGWPDILTTSLAPWDATVEGLRKGYAPPNARAVNKDSNRLYRNNRDGTFTDVTFDAKLYYPMGTMGAGVADVDNDGYVDFYFGTGDPQISRLEPNRFFRNNGNGTFSDLTRYVGFARPGNKGHGVAFVDLYEYRRARYLRPTRRPLSRRPRLRRLLSQPEGQPEQLAGSGPARREEQSLRGGRATHGEGRRPDGLSRSERQRRFRRHQPLPPAFRARQSRRKSIRWRFAGPAE